jgi:hypothetical protein
MAGVWEILPKARTPRLTRPADSVKVQLFVSETVKPEMDRPDHRPRHVSTLHFRQQVDIGETMDSQKIDSVKVVCTEIKRRNDEAHQRCEPLL